MVLKPGSRRLPQVLGSGYDGPPVETGGRYAHKRPEGHCVVVPMTGLTCASCSDRVEKALRKFPGVLEGTVNLASEQATIS